MIEHLTFLAARHLEARFIWVDAENAPFLTEKLNIWMLPTIVCLKDNKVCAPHASQLDVAHYLLPQSQTGVCLPCLELDCPHSEVCALPMPHIWMLPITVCLTDNKVCAPQSFRFCCCRRLAHWPVGIFGGRRRGTR